MNGSSRLETLLKTDRAVVTAGLATLTAVAWLYMIHEARSMSLTGVCQCAGIKMSGPDTQSWGGVELAGLFLMWAEMMVAMMVPSAAPMILLFAGVNRKRREQERPFVPTGIFLLGYLVVWIAFSGGAAVAQWSLHATALLSPMMVSTSPILGGGLLVAAGIFQWTPLKNTCLTHCRSSLSFLMTSWRDGQRGAFVMGLKHGAYCTGCCWVLMLLLFVAGVMNVLWIAAITALVLLEKVAPKGLWVARVTGLVLIGWGIWMGVVK